MVDQVTVCLTDGISSIISRYGGDMIDPDGGDMMVQEHGVIFVRSGHCMFD